jgi:type VI secretion system protein ImpM
MGGHQSGEMASHLVVDSLAEVACVEDLAKQIELFNNRLIEISDELCHYATGVHEGCVIGTTVVAMIAKGLHCAVLWAGDSRLYRFRHGQLQQITEDHTLVNELMTMGMTQETAVQQAGSNVITRAIGGCFNVELDIIEFEAQTGDRYLLCSDGLDKELSDADIARLMAGESCQSVAQALIGLALSRSGRDNITVAVVEVT